MDNLFFNSIGRVRSGWRVSLFLIAFMFFVTTVLLTVVKIVQVITGDADRFFTTSKGLALQATVTLLAALIVGWIFGKLLEDVPFRAIGISFHYGWLKDFAVGSAVGFFALLLAVGICSVFGGITLVFNFKDQSYDISMTLLKSLVVFAIGAIAEEVLFRGYIFQTLTRAKLETVAIVITSLLFSFAHNGNDNVTVFGLVNTALAGIWFGFAYLKTRSLWFAFGIHLFWNWTLAAFCGLPVSGITQIAPNPLFRGIDEGPTWLTGGHYGIEGGLACTIAVVIAILIVIALPMLRPTKEMMSLTSKEIAKEFENQDVN